MHSHVCIILMLVCVCVMLLYVYVCSWGQEGVCSTTSQLVSVRQVLLQVVWEHILDLEVCVCV